MQTNLLSPTNSVLSESEEMYLAAIARIQESKGTGPAPLSQLASSMEVLPVSANQMVRKLEEEGLVRYTPYKGVELTSAGAQAAQRILRHRRLWEIFLVELLHYTPEESDPLACRLEHILPTEAAERLAVFLGGRSEPPQSQPTSQNQEGVSGVSSHSLAQPGAPQRKRQNRCHSWRCCNSQFPGIARHVQWSLDQRCRDFRQRAIGRERNRSGCASFSQAGQFDPDHPRITMENVLINAPPQSVSGSCHNAPQAELKGLPLAVIVGSPNVGKSVLFNRLTGAYVTVSNYPGTTVEVTRGKARLGGLEIGVMDTPGMYNLLPITEEERVARAILLNERPAVVIHVVDAKNLERMLPMTLQLVEAGLPLVLVVNLMDEAGRLGIEIDIPQLQTLLGIPVRATALANGQGAKALKQAILERATQLSATDQHIDQTIPYPAVIESAIQGISNLLEGSYPLSRRTLALLLLQDDRETLKYIQDRQAHNAQEIEQWVAKAQQQYSQPLSFVISRAQRQQAQQIFAAVFQVEPTRKHSLGGRLSDAMIHPLTGVPILLAALFLLYEFVGVFGAQILVGWLETNLFNAYINPWVDKALAAGVPWPALRSLIGGEFGVVTLRVALCNCNHPTYRWNFLHCVLRLSKTAVIYRAWRC